MSLLLTIAFKQRRNALMWMVNPWCARRRVGSRRWALGLRHGRRVPWRVHSYVFNVMTIIFSLGTGPISTLMFNLFIHSWWAPTLAVRDRSVVCSFTTAANAQMATPDIDDYIFPMEVETFFVQHGHVRRVVRAADGWRYGNCSWRLFR